MKQLVYGIVRAADGPCAALPVAMGGGVLELVYEGELAAVSSVVPDISSAPSIADLLMYAGVIDQFHGRCAILPMRYGCLLEDQANVRHMLRSKHSDYLNALDRISGCDEFGLRVLPEKGSPADRDKATQPMPVAVTSLARGQGGAYLTARRARYAQQDADRRLACEVVERVRSFLQGTFTSCECEPGSQPGVMQSLSFLVQRDARARFRESFGRLQTQGQNKVLLTGPWPPYHFAPVQLNSPR